AVRAGVGFWADLPVPRAERAASARPGGLAVRRWGLPIGADGVRAGAWRDDLEPMNLVSLERATKAYAHRTLLDGISLGVSDRDRIGIVGRNGSGKSTLLAMLAGVTEPDTGRVARASGLRVGY